MLLVPPACCCDRAAGTVNSSFDSRLRTTVYQVQGLNGVRMHRVEPGGYLTAVSSRRSSPAATLCLPGQLCRRPLT